MSNEKLKETLDKIPFGLLLVLYIGYLAMDYYSFENDASSPKLTKKVEIENIENDIKTQKEKLEKARAFAKGLETKKQELRRLAQELDGHKATLTETIDIPGFMKLLLTEAKKVGLNVAGLKPTTQARQDYYSEQTFEMAFRGVYVQLLVFLDRLSQTQKIVRIDDFDMKPTSSSTARYVELAGTLQIKTYHYVGSKADDVGKAGDSAQTSGGAGGGGSGSNKVGGKKGGGGQ